MGRVVWLGLWRKGRRILRLYWCYVLRLSYRILTRGLCRRSRRGRGQEDGFPDRRKPRRIPTRSSDASKHKQYNSVAQYCAIGLMSTVEIDGKTRRRTKEETQERERLDALDLVAGLVIGWIWHRLISIMSTHV